MKAFDHDKPVNRDAWIFAFVGRYRELRPEIGENVKTLAVSACGKLKELSPLKAAEKWFKELQ